MILWTSRPFAARGNGYVRSMLRHAANRSHTPSTKTNSAMAAPSRLVLAV